MACSPLVSLDDADQLAVVSFHFLGHNFFGVSRSFTEQFLPDSIIIMFGTIIIIILSSAALVLVSGTGPSLPPAARGRYYLFSCRA